MHCRLEGKTKAWRDVSGWEGAMYYADFEPEYGWGEENYHGVWGEEVRVLVALYSRPRANTPLCSQHSACREGVVMVDMSFMSKFLVQGPEAGEFLNSLSTADVDGPVDTITYTQWLDGRGMMQVRSCRNICTLRRCCQAAAVSNVMNISFSGTRFARRRLT